MWQINLPIQATYGVLFSMHDFITLSDAVSYDYQYQQ